MNFHQLPANRKGPAPAQRDGEGGQELSTHVFAGEVDPRQSALRDVLLRFLSLAFKHRMMIAAFVGVGLLLGLIVTALTPRVYSAATVVKIDRAAPKVVNSQQPLVDGGADPQFYQTQYELIRSRSLAERVVTALNLPQSGYLEGERGGLLSFGAGATEESDPDLLRERQREAVKLVMDGLTVQPVPMSSLVRIRFASRSPEWAQRISIAIAEHYERSLLDRRFGVSQHARNFLEERLQQLKIKLQDSEKQLIEYAQQRGIVEIDEQKSQNLSLQGVQAALTVATTERVKQEQLWVQAQSVDGLELPQAQSDRVIQTARERLAQLTAVYQDKLAVLKPAFPEMVALRAQITDTERHIKAQVALVKDAIRAQYEAARAQEGALQDKLDELKADALEARGRSVELNILAREVDAARSLYEGLLQQFRELAVAGDVDTNNVSVIDRAERPMAHDRPSLAINLSLAMIASLLAAAGAVVVREALDDTFKSVEELEERLGLSVLGVAPMLDAQAQALTIIRDDPMSAFAEAHRSLRTALQFSTADGAPKSLMVTSSRPGEGKSTSSVCIAGNFAQLGLRVLLIDADLRNPSAHKLLGVENAAGLSNYLSGGGDYASLTQSCGVPGVSVLSSGPPPPNPAELLSGPRFATLISAASETFDVVIVDAPPVMGLADATIIGSVVSGVLMVVEAGRTRRVIARDALRRLHFARARMVGGLLNKFDPAAVGFGYGYGYGYGYEYGYGRYGSEPHGDGYYAYGRPPEKALERK